MVSLMYVLLSINAKYWSLIRIHHHLYVYIVDWLVRLFEVCMAQDELLEDRHLHASVSEQGWIEILCEAFCHLSLNL